MHRQTALPLSIFLLVYVFASQAAVAAPAPRPPSVASASEATPVASDTECLDLKTHCSSCRMDNKSALVSSKFHQHDGVDTQDECSARCKHADSCHGIVWNPRTQYCATFHQGSTASSKEPQDIDTKVLLCIRCTAQQVSPGQWRLKWSPEHLSSDNIEIATIFEGLQPNLAPFHSSSQKKVVMGKGKRVLLNNGTYLWDHDAQVGLSAKGWFSFRSLPFKHECSVPREESLRLQTAQCSIGVQARVDCGHDGVTNQECFAKGCCFDDSRPDAHNCFAPFASHETGRLVWWRLGHLCSKLLEYAAHGTALLASLVTQLGTPSGALLSLLLALTFVLHGQLAQTRQRLEKEEKTGILLARFRSLRMEMLAAEQNGRLMLTAGEQGQRCVVCWVNSPNIIFIPCGHLSCCHQCISKVWEQQLLDHHADLLCPCCQASVLHVTIPIAIAT